MGDRRIGRASREKEVVADTTSSFEAEIQC